MSYLTCRLTMALGTLMLAGWPIAGGAQSTPTPATGQTRPPSTASEQSRSAAKDAKDQGSPQHHIDQARRALDTINSNELKGETRTQFTELREHFNLLNSAWQAKTANLARAGAAGGHATGHVGTGSGSTGGTTSGTAAATAAGTSGTPEQAGATGATVRPPPRGDEGLATHYEAIKKILARMNGMDAETSRKLAEFRQHLDRFYTLATTQQGRTREDPAPSETSTTGVSASVRDPLAPEYASTPPSAAGEDSDVFARLNAQIDELLRTASAPAATGTSGNTEASGTICVERAKLEALKRDIQSIRKR